VRVFLRRFFPSPGRTQRHRWTRGKKLSPRKFIDIPSDKLNEKRKPALLKRERLLLRERARASATFNWGQKKNAKSTRNRLLRLRALLSNFCSIPEAIKNGGGRQ